MYLHDWAKRWGIAPIAMEDLALRLGTISTDPTPVAGESEAAIQNQIRLEASSKGARLWRNNVGAMYDENRRLVRYGLANESQAINRVIKSSDLIGLRPIRIEQHHVGTVIGQFVAREVKSHVWEYTNKPREIAQLKFIELIISMGGDAAFANQVGTL